MMRLSLFAKLPTHNGKLHKLACDLPTLNLMPDLAEFMTVKEAAQELGFTVHGIRKLIKKTKLEFVTVGNFYLVSRKSVKEYLEQTSGMSKNDPTRGKQPKEQ